jgi:hypothetical protein
VNRFCAFQIMKSGQILVMNYIIDPQLNPSSHYFSLFILKLVCSIYISLELCVEADRLFIHGIQKLIDYVIMEFEVD